MLKDKMITGAPGKIKFPPKQLPCKVCLEANGIASKVVVNDVEHRKTTYPGQSLCLDNMGPITITDENGETSALRYLNVVSDRHTGCFIGTTLVETKAQTAREQDTVIRRTHRHCLKSGGTHTWTWTSGRTYTRSAPPILRRNKG